MKNYFFIFIATAIAASWLCCCASGSLADEKDPQKECFMECNSQYERCVNPTQYIPYEYSREAGPDFHGTEKRNCMHIRTRCHEKCVK